MSERAAVILAAGQGTRMKSPIPKVLHKVGGRALIDHAIDAAEGAGCTRIVVVINNASPAVAAHVATRLGAETTVVQDPPLGTGHAVLAAKAALAGFEGDVVVTYADGVLPASAIAPLFELRAGGADVAVLGFETPAPSAFGRLVLGAGGSLEKIVEAKDATPAELAITACNSGILAAPAGLLFDLLGKVGRDNAKGEYYLTDIVGLARAAGLTVRAAFAPEDAFQAPNSQAELAEAEAAFQRRRRTELMEGGVTLVAPETVFLSWDTEIAAGVLVEPNVIFAPGVAVETGATIRAFSHLEGAVVHGGAIIGPYARLRPGADSAKTPTSAISSR
jgi:bifunctional UDP-N-acetylglucosamine pyrophosphorylase / glucosamine-1-phosphate N-acetyltransferase